MLQGCSLCLNMETQSTKLVAQDNPLVRNVSDFISRLQMASPLPRCLIFHQQRTVSALITAELATGQISGKKTFLPSHNFVAGHICNTVKNKYNAEWLYNETTF